MSNYLSIKLKQIKYSGDNIGRELKFKLKIGDQVAEMSIKLPRGESRSLDKVIFQKTSKEKIITLPIAAEVKETSERYIDYGSGASRFKIQLKGRRIQKHIFGVEVKGSGRERGKIAIFTFVLEASVESAICYVSDVWPNGWLRVKFDNGDIYPLPQMLKVEIIKIEKGREYFNILEGRFRGCKASVGLEDGKSHLSRKGEHKGPARLVFDQKAEKLAIDGLGKYNADMDENNPLPPGRYDLEIPYELHPKGAPYLSSSKYAKTWFRIGHKGKRFLHVGRISAGCITVIEKNKWTEIYNFLIRSRKDNISVGEVIVK